MMKKQRFSSIITVIGCLLILLISACGNDDADDDDYNNDYDDSEHPITGYTHIEWALAKALGKVPGEEITPSQFCSRRPVGMAIHRVASALCQPEGVKSFRKPSRRSKFVGWVDWLGAIRSF
jgi:hypothetical protein